MSALPPKADISQRPPEGVSVLLVSSLNQYDTLSSPYYDGVASAFGTIFVVFPSCNTSATLDAIRRDVAPTRPTNSCFCASQICTIASIQGVAVSSDPFAFLGRAFELA
jgi:hypothetical protein